MSNGIKSFTRREDADFSGFSFGMLQKENNERYKGERIGLSDEGDELIFRFDVPRTVRIQYWELDF